MKQLALGGVLELPCYDKANNLVRDKNGNMIFSERFFPPDVRALTFILDRCDPQPRENEVDAQPSNTPELTDAEALAEAKGYYDLFAASFKIMIELGMEPPAAWKGLTIETSATLVDVTPANQPANESETPAPTPSATTIATEPSDKPPEAF